jgi:hypothetical protein
MATKYNDNEIVALVNEEVNSSAGFLDSEINNQRKKSMEYFYGEPFGNEEDGRSQVVVTDVQDTLMWIMPSLMRIFTAGDRVVKFLPEGPEDEAVAEQATRYVNHVFYKQNNGYMVLYNFFLDALMQKVGVVKHYWEEIENTTTEEYESLTDAEFNALLADDDLELDQHTEEVEQKLVDTTDPMTGEPIQVMTEDREHDAVFIRRSKEGKVTIENIPPEEFLISNEARTIKDARFVCHRSSKTKSELLKMGFDRDLVEDLPYNSSGANGITTTPEYMARHAYDATDTTPAQAAVPSEQTVEVFESYMRLDMEGDGITVLHKIISAGNTLLSLEPVDTIPFSSVCPIPIPHKFFGLSVSETVEDVQLIRSTLTRNLLDNMYLANNGRFQVVEGQVNIDDLLTSRPGGIVRTRSLNALQPIQTPALQNYSFQMLEYWDAIKAGRTGVNAATQGLPADVLKSHVTAGAITGALSNAQGRVELIARTFAETGVRDLFKSIYNIIQRFEERKKIIRVQNQYYEIDPASWREDMDVEIRVGLGYGDNDVRVQSLTTFANFMNQVAQATQGIINPENIYNMMREVGEELGIKNVDKFVSPPPPPAPPQPSTQDQVAQAQAQAMLMQAQSAQMEAQVKAKRLEIEMAKLELDRLDLETNVALKKEELKLKGVELGYEMASKKNVRAN